MLKLSKNIAPSNFKAIYDKLYTLPTKYIIQNTINVDVKQSKNVDVREVFSTPFPCGV